MRIAINAALLGKRHTGVGTYISGLSYSLSSLGHEVWLYGSSPHLPAALGIMTHRTPRSIAYDAGPLAGLFRLLWNVAILPMRLWSKKIDALISQNAEGSVWCSVPQLLVVHDLIPLLYPDEAPRLRSYYKKLLPLVLRHSRAIAAVSNHTRSDLLQHYKLGAAYVHVAYNAVHERPVTTRGEVQPNGLPLARYFLFVGTFSPRKNLETVIRALAKVREHVRESLVIVAYPDTWTSGCMQLLEELELQDRAICVSGLTDEEMSYVYRHATALFLLSEYEGFGLPPLEAMVAGTPAVVSDSTALDEVAGDAAIKIGAHDVEAAAEAMLRLSTDPAYREGMRQLGLHQARAFTWERTAQTISELLAQIVPSNDLNKAR